MPKNSSCRDCEFGPGEVVGIFKTAFGMKQVRGMGGAIYLSDGSINLALNKIYIGRDPGIYHFGVEVEDIEALKKKLKEAGARSEVKKRPSKPRSRIPRVRS